MDLRYTSIYFLLRIIGTSICQLPQPLLLVSGEFARTTYDFSFCSEHTYKIHINNLRMAKFNMTYRYVAFCFLTSISDTFPLRMKMLCPQQRILCFTVPDVELKL